MAIEPPDIAPAMILSNVVLFPGMMLPLRIFEPRYRRMLEDVLEADRQFVIATRAPDTDNETPADTACLGLVRASVASPDGTSQLFLLGLTRVKVEGLVPDRPYPTLRLSRMADLEPDSVRAEALALKVRELARQRFNAPGLKDFGAQIDAIDSASQLADTLAHVLIPDPALKLELLATPGVPHRLERLIAFLMEKG